MHLKFFLLRHRIGSKIIKLRWVKQAIVIVNNMHLKGLLAAFIVVIHSDMPPYGKYINLRSVSAR